jgi:hypothetical protein
VRGAGCEPHHLLLGETTGGRDAGETASGRLVSLLADLSHAGSLTVGQVLFGEVEARVGLGRVAASSHRASTVYQIC